MTRRSGLAILVLLSLLRVEGQQGPAEVEGPWEFAIGARTERLLITADRMPVGRRSVSLPHRVPEPNTSLWYARDLDLRLGTALDVDADDGAQVFVGGRRLGNYRHWFPVPADLTGPQRVVIRVLNNAMQGGLRRVAVVDARAVSSPPADRIPEPRGFEPVELQSFRNRMPAAGDPCSFTAWADSQGGWKTFARLADLMAERNPSFAAGVGDLVSDGSDPQAWPQFVQALSPLAARSPIVPIAGNHDYDGYYNNLRAELYEQWFRRETSTWFSWSCGPLRLVAIDVNREFPIGIGEGSTQWNWLQAETQSGRWKSAGWRIVLVHQPPWSRSWAGYDGDLAVRRIVEPLVRERGLDVVISGHSHAYEHLVRTIGSRTLHVMITGGGGGSLEDVEAEKLGTPTERIAVRHHFLHATAGATELTFDAVGLDGLMFDRVSIPRAPVSKRPPRH